VDWDGQKVAAVKDDDYRLAAKESVDELYRQLGICKAFGAGVGRRCGAR
jgi:hypothetical protein